MTANIPAPNVRSTLPCGVTCTSGATFEPAQEFPPQRSNTQMLPRLSMSIPLAQPQRRPSLDFAQLSSW